MTPLFLPLVWQATDLSFSTNPTRIPEFEVTSCRATAHPIIPPPTMIMSKFNRHPLSVGRIGESLLVKQVFRIGRGPSITRGAVKTGDLLGVVKRPMISTSCSERIRSDLRNLPTISYIAMAEVCSEEANCGNIS